MKVQVDEMGSLPAFLAYQPYERAGVLSDIDVYLYLGIAGEVEQYAAHVGLITVTEGVFVLPDGQQYEDQEKAIMALWEVEKGAGGEPTR